MHNVVPRRLLRNMGTQLIGADGPPLDLMPRSLLHAWRVVGRLRGTATALCTGHRFAVVRHQHMSPLQTCPGPLLPQPWHAAGRRRRAVTEPSGTIAPAIPARSRSATSGRRCTPGSAAPKAQPGAELAIDYIVNSSPALRTPRRSTFASHFLWGGLSCPVVAMQPPPKIDVGNTVHAPPPPLSLEMVTTSIGDTSSLVY